MANAKWVNLTASTVETLTFARKHYKFVVTNLGAALTDRVMLRFNEGGDTTAPVVNTDGSHCVRAGETREFHPRGGATQVRLVSPSTPAVNVEAE